MLTMIETTTRRWTTVVTVIRVLIVVEAMTFLLAALLHQSQTYAILVPAKSVRRKHK
jgi:hypothetical protein